MPPGIPPPPPAPLKRSSSTTIVPSLGSYTTLQGNTAGFTLIGGTTTSGVLTLQAYSPAYDNEATGRINLKSPLTWTDNVNVNASLSGFFQSGQFKLFEVTGTFTLENTMNAGGVNVVSASYTLQYSSSQAVTAAPVFVGLNVIQPTTNVADGTAVLWSDFQASSIYRPNLATAITAVTRNFIGFISSPRVQIQSGSHASATAFVQNLTGYDAFASLLDATTSQAVAGNVRGLFLHNPTKNGTGIINNNIGIEIESMTAGSDSNFAIKTGASGRVSFGAAVETPTVRLKDSNGTQWDFTTDTSGNLDVTGVEVAFDPMVNIDWYALYMASRLSYADTADVTLWEDVSGNFRHLEQGNAVDVPVMETVATALNNQKAVEFTRASSQALISRETVAISTSATGFTFIGVLSFKTVAAVQRFFSHAQAANTRGAGISATPNWTTNMGATANSAGTPATATKYFVRVLATNAAHTLFVNEVSTATSATASTALNQIVLGAGRGALGPNNYFDGYIAMAGVYDGDITAHGQWARFKTYLNSTYGFAL